MMSRITALNNLLVKVSSSLKCPFLLAVRLFWGWQFMLTGWGKFHRMSGVIEYFTNLGIPAPAANAYFVSGLEFVGGILLILGLFSRWIALPLVFDMIVAYITADKEAVSTLFMYLRHPFTTEIDKFVNAAPFGFLLASLIILIFGPGKIALDTLLSKDRDAK
jgi:putative oxidoreductase